MKHIYLFVLSPPFSGSTVLWRLLGTSPHTSALRAEGQHLPAVRDIMRPDRWNPAREMPWPVIRAAWEAEWDLSKRILLEKSPPHLMRANQIEAAFPNSYFIANVRNPYAFCEGYARRTNQSLADAAAFWVRCADQLQHNLATLTHILPVTYEALTENSAETSARILRFLPELETLDASASFKAHSVLGSGAQPLQNLNGIKIDRLSAENLSAINAVLRPHTPLLNAFGYSLLQPNWQHTLRHWRTRAASLLTRSANS